MKSSCSHCGDTLSKEERKNGSCYNCDYQFNPMQSVWERESPELYEGNFIDIEGETRSIRKMAEQLLTGKIIKIFGVFAVTTKGIECLDHNYSIDTLALNDPNLLKHMTDKSWVNSSDFSAALNFAKSL